MASVRRVPNSPYWVARLRAWVALEHHPAGGFWRKTDRSTKVSTRRPKREAQRVADEMERIAQETKSSSPDKAFWESRLAALMRAANVDQPKKTITWSQASKAFLASITAGDRSGQQYAQQIDLFTAFLGGRARHDLRSVSSEDFIEFYRQLQREGRSANTARNAAKTIRRVLERTHLLGFIEANVAKLHRLPSGDTIQRKPFTKEDLAAIFSHIQNHESDEWRIACLFGLYYGLRIGDAVSRKYEDIVTENKVRVLRFVPQKKRTKGREIVLPVVGELGSIDTSGKGFITPTLAALENPSKAFGKLLDRAKLPRSRAKAKGQGRATSDKSFHSFRHTINSLLVDAGVDQRVRQLICDHEDDRVAAGYTHASVTTMAKAITKAVSLPSSR